MKAKIGVIAATLIVAVLAGLSIARGQENPPAMPAGEMPMMMEPGAGAGAPPPQTNPNETMGQMGQMGMMTMMQQMSEMMELCMQMMRSMMGTPGAATGGTP